MYLDLDSLGLRMKLVYELSRHLKANPQFVADVQALTLNSGEPLAGYNGTHGLFGSDEWWGNIRSGKIPTKTLSGVITETYFAGQDARWGESVNSFRMFLPSGVQINESFYAHNRGDYRLFRVGATVWIAYVLNEMKEQPASDGCINYAETVLEMAVSLDTPIV